MTAEANKLAVRRVYEEVFNQGTLAVVDEVIAADFVTREAHPASTLPGPEAIRTAATVLRTAFPDLHFTIEELVAEGELVAGRLTMRGTNQGPLLGIPPTGRAVEQAQMHFLRFRDGKAVEHWAVRDDAGLLRQLGVSALPGGAGHAQGGG